MIPWRKILRHDILKCIFSGLLLILGWPPIAITPLLFLALIPLFTVIARDLPVKRVWFYSYVTFFVWTIGTMYWIGNTRLNLQGFLIITIAWVLIPFFQSLPFVVFGWIKKGIDQHIVWFALPVVWVSYEYLHSNWQLAFTWLHLGFGLSPMPWLIQFYEITGYLGGSFLIILVNVLLFLIISNPFNFGRLSRRALVVIILLVMVSNLWLYLQSENAETKKIIKVAVVQSNGDPYQELNAQSLRNQVQSLQHLLKPLKKDEVDLVVLSEGFLRTSPMAPLILNDIDAQPAVKEIKKISRRINAPILVGFIGFKLFEHKKLMPAAALPTGDGRFFSAYNGAMLVSHDQPTQIQMKNNLVPFMERIPFLQQFSFFEQFKLQLNQARKSYAKDDVVNVFEYKNMRIGTLICLDALFPEYAVKFVEQQANVIAIIANDSWAGNTAGYLQNAQYASTVAVSLRKEVIRCATTGQSMFVESSGNKNKVTPWNEVALVIHDVQLIDQKPYYAYTNSWVGLICLVASVLVLSYSVCVTRGLYRPKMSG